jgi:hypothetical protein
MFDVPRSMFEMRRTAWCAILVAAFTGFFSSGSVLADSPTVTAVLSNSEAAVGEAVRLQIRITGSAAKPPGQITVDGLEIRQAGTEQHYEMNNFNVSQSVIYNYTVVPVKAGKFKIPPQTIQMGGTSLRTPELALNVSGSAAGSARANPNTAQPSIDPKKIAFIELIVPKTEAYVGEVVPVVLKLCINPRVKFQQIALDQLEINAQGLTVQKLTKSGENMEAINGATYDVVTFKTALAAVRTGKFEIPAMEMKAVVLLPERRPANGNPRGPRSPFDIFNIDPFNDPLFGDLIGRPHEITIRSEPVTLQMKPLPPNAPASFSGAVGNFAMTAEANPKSVQVGDPITVTATISGRGNFDRVNAPAIEDDRGWHKYPPSSKFKQDDDVGISGTKTFETVLSPNEKKKAVPAFAFSYFDPVKEQYVALRSEPVPIQVEGNALPTAAPPAAITNPQSAPTGSVRPASKPQDILYQLTELPARVQSFTPLYARPVFWMAQLIPLLALLGIAGWKIRQTRIDNRDAQRMAVLQQEATELLRKLRRKDTPSPEYFLQVSRAVQVKTALARNLDPNIVDAEVAAKTFGLDEGERAQLRRLFARSDEMRYSGAQNGAGAITPQDRSEVLEFIESLRV